MRAFQKQVAGREIRMRKHFLMRFHLGSAVIWRDAAGNPALDKRHFNRRIDAASAAVIAAGLRSMAAAKRPLSGGPGFRIV